MGSKQRSRPEWRRRLERSSLMAKAVPRSSAPTSKAECKSFSESPLTQGGAPARSAVVTLSQGERVQRRVIDAGGYLPNGASGSHGLGANESAVNVEVRWPDGRQHQLNGLAADQVVQVPYPSEEW